MRELTVVEAVREALEQEMERDSRVVLLGEDIGRLGGVFRATDGLLDRFGPQRVVDSPMAELGIAGIAVGLAMRGLRPVAEIQFADFIHAAADHLIGEAAKVRYRTAGDWTCPMVVRTAYGGGFRGGPYHSQSVEAFFSHVPGLKVVSPATPSDAKGLLTSAIRDPDPVIVLEHKLTYRAIKGPVPEGEYLVPIGSGSVARKGSDVTIVSYGMMLHESLAAAELLAAEALEAEVIDLRTLLPIDFHMVLDSVRRTGRLCVVHEDTRTMGLGAEVAAVISERAMEQLIAPPVRLTMPDVGGIPVADPLEDALIPNRQAIVEAVRSLVHRRAWTHSRPLTFDSSIPEATSVVEVTVEVVKLHALLEAVSRACGEFPNLNAEFAWDGIRLHPQVRVAVDLGPLSPPSAEGTFTVIDYGPGSSRLGIPSVRPGQTAALRVGAPINGQVWLALTVDHRAVDGADAGRFLNRVKQLMEQ